MKRNIKLSAVLSAGLAIASINAHAVWNTNSIGDDGNPRTDGNAGAKAKNVQAMLNVNNQTDAKIDRVVIVNKANKQLYAAQLACGINKACTLNLGKITFPEDVILKFYDAKNHMVSAYNYMGKLDRSDMITIDDKWLGIYVFYKLKQSSQMSPDVLNSELTYFFQNYSSPDGTPDIFEELGLYFLAQNGGVNEDKFYKELLKKLEQDKVLGAKVISPTMVKSMLTKSSEWTEFTPDGLMCNKIANGLATWAKFITGFIPVIGSSVGTILNVSTQTSKTLCTSDGSVNQRFDQINNELKRLDTEVRELGYSLKALSQRLDQEVARLYLSRMEDRYRDMSNAYFVTYNGLNMSLVSFVNNTSGLRSSFKNNNNVRTLISSMQQQLNTFDTFVNTGNLDSFKSSLDRWCSNEQSMTGDIIKDRIQCNLMKNQVVSYLYTGAAQLQLMLGDEINTVIAARKSGDIDTTWLVGNIAGIPNGFGGKGWDNSVDYVNKHIETRLDQAITILIGKDGKDIYNPLKGFPEKLSDSMKAANCGYKTENGNVLPAVSEWVLNNGKQQGPYIVSACHSENEVVNARYYYMQKNSSTIVNDDVVNVMGVLVPSGYFHNPTSTNFPFISYWRGVTTISSKSDDNQLKAIFVVPKDTKALGYGFHPENMKEKYLAPKGFTEHFMRNGKSYVRNIFTPTTSSNGNPAFEVSYYMADWWQIGRGEFYSFIRNTDKSGVSHVWAIRSLITAPLYSSTSNSTNLNLRELRISQQCMTTDCSIDTSDYKNDFALGEISFPTTKISWHLPNYSSMVENLLARDNPAEFMMYVDGKPVYSK